MIEVLATTEELTQHLHDLKHMEREPYISEERKQSIRREMGHLSFELVSRVKEGL